MDPIGVAPIGWSKDVPWTLEAADRYCERLARTHYENFTVGSWLLPKSQRRHVYAIYGYCRTVDDLGDEDTAAENTATGESPPDISRPWKCCSPGFGGSLGRSPNP